jgi:hypothetical protein
MNNNQRENLNLSIPAPSEQEVGTNSISTCILIFAEHRDIACHNRTS